MDESDFLNIVGSENKKPWKKKNKPLMGIHKLKSWIFDPEKMDELLP